MTDPYTPKPKAEFCGCATMLFQTCRGSGEELREPRAHLLEDRGEGLWQVGVDLQAFDGNLRTHDGRCMPVKAREGGGKKG